MDKLGDLLKEVNGPDNVLQARIVLDKTNGILYVNDVPLLAYVSYDMELEGLTSHELMKLNIGIFVGAMEVIDNLRPACQPCNRQRGDMTLDEWRQLYGRTTPPLTPSRNWLGDPDEAPHH